MQSQYIPSNLYARIEREWLAIKHQPNASILSPKGQNPADRPAADMPRLAHDTQ